MISKRCNIKLDTIRVRRPSQHSIGMTSTGLGPGGLGSSGYSKGIPPVFVLPHRSPCFRNSLSALAKVRGLGSVFGTITSTEVRLGYYSG